VLAELGTFVRYLSALPGYLRTRVSVDEARRRLGSQLARRETAFLAIVRHGILGNPVSPYRALLRHAGVEHGDIARQVGRDGVEATLGALYDAGVHLTIDEFKGLQPIVRPGLHLTARPADFDNPLLARHYEGRSSGSRGPGTRVIIDLDLLAHEAAYFHQYLGAFARQGRPLALWFPVPPGAAGMKWALRLAQLGAPPARWFSPAPIAWGRESWKFALFTHFTLLAARAVRNPLPVPRHVAAGQVGEVLRWLAEVKRAGTPAVLATSPSAGVRICQGACEGGLDIGGTLFIFGGEPFTRAKAEVIQRAGCQGVNHYSMVEVGNVGLACGEPAQWDDVHLVSDKIAVIQRQRSLGGQDQFVEALVYTTILPSCPKLMLNVESGDFGDLSERPCGCFLGQLGFTRHLSGIRSYEKLTSEGVTFLGTGLLRLVDEVLPQRFGGSSVDYQLVESEEGGRSRISVIVSPQRGQIDEAAVLATVFEVLGEAPGGAAMLDHWRQARTLRVLRQEPHATSSAKVLPLHVQQLSPLRSPPILSQGERDDRFGGRR
jgi:hypothetical protein